MSSEAKYYLTDADGREWSASEASFAAAAGDAGFSALEGDMVVGFKTDARFDVNGRPTIYVKGRVENA